MLALANNSLPIPVILLRVRRQWYLLMILPDIMLAVRPRLVLLCLAGVPALDSCFFLLLPILHELILVALNSYLSWHLAWTHSGLPQIARGFQRLFCFSSSYCRLFFFWFSLKFFIAVNMSCPVILSLSPAGSLSFYGPWRPSANLLPARCLLAPVQIQLYN